MASEGDRPSVLDPDETWHMPARVYLAARPDGVSAGPMLELRECMGQSVVLAYSSLDLFLHGCGADQPWILLPSERLTDLADDGSQGFRFSVLLDVPLSAYGGVSDPKVSADELRAWHEQTTGLFRVQLLAGGHFFVQTAQPVLLRSLTAALGAGVPCGR